MRFTTFSLLGISILALLLVAGCEDSKTPLSSPAAAKLDESLIGVWRHQDNGSTTYYLAGRLGGKAPEGMLRVVIVTHEKNGELHRPYQGILFPTTLDGVSYLNLAGASQKQLAQIKEKGWQPDLLQSYFILKYRVEEGAVLAWPMDVDAKKQAVQAGKIKGEIKDDNTPAKFTDTMENLAKLLSETKDTLFHKDPQRFERVR